MRVTRPSCRVAGPLRPDDDGEVETSPCQLLVYMDSGDDDEVRRPSRDECPGADPRPGWATSARRRALEAPAARLVCAHAAAVMAKAAALRCMLRDAGSDVVSGISACAWCPGAPSRAEDAVADLS